jgi:Ca2+-binding RTX toxin-like protein
MRARIVLTLVSVLGALTWATPADAATATCDGRTATIVGTANSEVIDGTSGDDVIVGGGGNDAVNGRGGNDHICGGYGADRLSGGLGADRLFGGPDQIAVTDEGTERIGDQLRGGGGNDRLVPGRDTRAADDVSHDVIAWDTSPHSVHIDIAAGSATGDGHDSFVGRPVWVVGSPYADVIDGGNRRDLINAGPGSDLVRAYGGGDRVIVDLGRGVSGGRDVVWGGPGDDQLSSGSGEDTVHGGAGNDVIDDMGRSADRLYGGDGADLLISDLVDNGTQQVLSGGAGKDQITLFSNYVNPTAGPATGTWDMTSGVLEFDVDQPFMVKASGFEAANLSTFGGTWDVTGTSGADSVNVGSTAGGTFRGLEGNDSFLGSAFDDVFRGGPGTDHSLGMGAGTDTCDHVEIFDAEDCETITP